VTKVQRQGRNTGSSIHTLPSGCVQGCTWMEPISTFRRVFAKLTMPFISKYKLSTSNPFGLGRLVSGGRVTVPPFSSETAIGWSSMTCSTKAPGQLRKQHMCSLHRPILGYFLLSHRNKAGTPCYLLVRERWAKHALRTMVSSVESRLSRVTAVSCIQCQRYTHLPDGLDRYHSVVHQRTRRTFHPP
jgi:hypothetical protein